MLHVHYFGTMEESNENIRLNQEGDAVDLPVSMLRSRCTKRFTSKYINRWEGSQQILLKLSHRLTSRRAITKFSGFVTHSAILLKTISTERISVF